MTTDPSSIGTTGPPVTPGPGAIYPSVGTLVYTSAMISAINQEHNLQAMVELQYVRVGTEVMNDALSSLDQALTVTQNALGLLTNLQNLHNQIAVSANSAFPFNFTFTGPQTLTVNSTASTTLLTITAVDTAGVTITQTIPFPVPTTPYVTTTTFLVHDQNSYIQGYQKLASSFYGQPVKPYFHVDLPATGTHPAFNSTITSAGQPAYIAFKSSLLSTRASLSGLIAQLSAITQPGDSTTLYNQLKTVYDNIPSPGMATFSAIKAWAIDNYGGSSGPSITQAGQFQQQITNAITAAESLNTSQTQSVQRYMFVFEQYCQSAAAVLSALQQLFDRIARGISG